MPSHTHPDTLNSPNALVDPRGEGHAPLAAWASTQNALKVAIFRFKIENIFWGGDNAPSPDPS